jgi:hypothetical protein
MTTGRTLRPVHLLGVFVESLLLATAIVMLGKYFGWHLGPPSLY